jgi:acetylornithine deacetylase
MLLPVDDEVGACTLNIGLIEGGRATNVIADYARAQLLYRLIGPSQGLREQITQAVKELVEVQFPLEIPFVRLRAPEGLPTMIAAFTTDIPALSNWGEPLLVGPGSIHVAHTEREFLSKAEQAEAIELYCTLAHRLVRKQASN